MNNMADNLAGILIMGFFLLIGASKDFHQMIIERIGYWASQLLLVLLFISTILMLLSLGLQSILPFLGVKDG